MSAFFLGSRSVARIALNHELLVTRVCKKNGTFVCTGERIIEGEFGKWTFDLFSPIDGIFRINRNRLGQLVPKGRTLYSIVRD